MKVFNLTSKPLDYRGVVLAPNGGSHDYREMDFIPNRDITLVEKRVIAFGKLPQWFIDEMNIRHLQMVKEQKPSPLPTAVKAVETVEENKQNFKKK